MHRFIIVFKLIFALTGVMTLSSTWASWLALGGSSGCMVTNEGTVQCWGNATLPFATEVANSSATTAAVAAGSTHHCALMSNGNVTCWGNNNLGQLGRGGPLGTPSSDSVQAAVKGFEATNGTYAATQIVAGSDHTCVIITIGKVRCWGRGNNGQLGNTDLINKTESVEIPGIIGADSSTTAIAVAAGHAHSCALLKTGSVQCWGANTTGQLGIGNTNSPLATPQAVIGLANVKAIATGAGAYHTCALTNTGEVWCWGNNNHGQIGLNPNDPNWNFVLSSPTKIISSGVAEIAVASNHSCARMTADNKVQCWGANNNGQLGDGSVVDRSVPTPTLIPPVRYLAIGGDLKLRLQLCSSPRR